MGCLSRSALGRNVSAFRSTGVNKKGGILLNRGKILTLMIAILILNLSSLVPVQGAPKTQFSIVYTNDVMGEVEPCG
jgi:hypothetical protein